MDRDTGAAGHAVIQVAGGAQPPRGPVTRAAARARRPRAPRARARRGLARVVAAARARVLVVAVVRAAARVAGHGAPAPTLQVLAHLHHAAKTLTTTKKYLYPTKNIWSPAGGV